MEKHNLRNIISRINCYQNKILKENNIFTIIFGSFAYNGFSKNDIDIMSVTRNTLDFVIKERLIEEYRQLHFDYNLIPDEKFPGEYITLNQIKESQKGRGFKYNNGVKITKLTSFDWDEENEYRHHLSVLGGPTIYVSGDEKLLKENKIKSLMTLVGVSILSDDLKNFNKKKLINSLIRQGKEYLGFSNISPIKSYLDLVLEEVLSEFEKKGTLIRRGSNYSIFNPNFLNQLEYNIKTSYTENEKKYK